jgi:hypothetical protein
MTPVDAEGRCSSTLAAALEPARSDWKDRSSSCQSVRVSVKIVGLDTLPLRLASL